MLLTKYFGFQVRDVVTTLRTHSVENVLLRYTDLVAVKDVVTRWGSTKRMIQRLIDMRPALQQLEGLNIGKCYCLVFVVH